MRAKTDMQARARELRLAGRTYAEIQAELGVAKSSISLWVRDLPRPRTSPERARRAAETRWGPARERADAERRATKAAAAAEIGTLSERDLFLLGVALYWAEGTKDKPYDRREKVIFTNSDPGVILLFMSWLRLLGVEMPRLRLRVAIHESADVRSAERFWAELIGVPVGEFQRPTLKRHNPKTVRKNTGAEYHGCLVVSVLGSADLYRRIEGWWSGMVVDVGPRNP